MQIQNNNTYLIALVNDKIVGMLMYGKSRDDKYKESGEINAIYILKEYQGKGIGKKLFLEAIKYLVDENYDNMIIGCLEGNPSNNFYIKMGGKLDYKTEFNIGGKGYLKNVFYFNDIKSYLSYIEP
nr:GNAT family N-acetyltransferase [Sedimentibacter sp.]